MFEKDMKVSLLLDFYGEILSERRREIIEMYYNEDLSLSEIAEITGITRQGVRDSVKKSEAELLELEKTLGLAERFQNVKDQISRITSEIDEAIMQEGDKEVIGILRSVKDSLDKLDI